MYKISVLLFITCVAVCYCTAAAPAEVNQLWWNSVYKQRTLSHGCAKMCCNGKNSTCFSTGRRMDGKGSYSSRCFCDAGCLDMGDCCEDYSVECQAVDCMVGEWADYGTCSRPCGLGAQTRQREVITEPRNGGNECPSLKETRVCTGTRCLSQRHLGGSRGRTETETAKIMPASFAKFRKFKNYNANLDIRKNLFYRYYYHQFMNKKSYCAQYRITSTRKGCTASSSPFWSDVLRKGSTICVECQKHAMDDDIRCTGHGIMNKETYWRAVNAPGCHGWWERVTELSGCSCKDNRGLDFIFV